MHSDTTLPAFPRGTQDVDLRGVHVLPAED